MKKILISCTVLIVVLLVVIGILVHWLHFLIWNPKLAVDIDESEYSAVNQGEKSAYLCNILGLEPSDDYTVISLVKSYSLNGKNSYGLYSLILADVKKLDSIMAQFKAAGYEDVDKYDKMSEMWNDWGKRCFTEYVPDPKFISGELAGGFVRTDDVFVSGVYFPVADGNEEIKTSSQIRIPQYTYLYILKDEKNVYLLFCVNDMFDSDLTEIGRLNYKR